LSQKLCDIRRQTALAALTNLDNEFLLVNDELMYEVTQAEIQALRIRYAKDLLCGKKFVFGKYTVLNDGGEVCILALFFDRCCYIFTT
jgi:tRNA A22 N-methylase